MAHLGIFLTIFGAAFAMSPWTAGQYAIPKVMALSIGCLLIWASILVRSLRGNQRKYWMPMTSPSLYFLAVIVLCTISSLDWSMSIFGHYRSYTDNLLTIAALIGVAHGVALSRDHVSDRFLIYCFGFIMVTVPLYAFAQTAGYEFPGLMSLVWKTEQGHIMPSSGFGHPVYLGTAIAFLFPLSLWMVTERKSRIIGVVICSLLIVAAVLTTKRGIWLGIFSGGFAFLVMTGHILMSRRKGLLFLVAVVAGLAWYSPRLFESGSDVARMEAWKVAVSAFKDNPMVGTGPDTFTIPFRQKKTFVSVISTKSSRYVHFNAHNDFLQIAATMGFYGITAYLLMLMGMAFTFADIVKNKAPSVYSAFAGGLVGVFVIAKVNPIPISTLMLCAVAAGFIMRARVIESPAVRMPIKYSALTFALCLPVVFFVSKALAADYYRMESFKNRKSDPLVSAQLANKAARLAPWVFEIRKDQAQSLFFLPMKATREMGLMIAEQAVKIGESCIKYHPHNSEAHVLYASTLLIRQHWGGEKVPEEAMKYMDSAQKMAPLFRPLMIRRSMIAGILNDRKRHLSARESARTVKHFEDLGSVKSGN